MLKVTFLEDPDIDDTAVSFMLSGEEVESLDMTCRGGESCCGRESNRQGNSGFKFGSAGWDLKDF